MSDAPLGSFEEQVLLALLRVGEEPYGMAVRRKIEEATGRDVTTGAVYATLDRLEAKGLAASWKSEGPARRLFRVTAAGAEALLETRAMRQRLWDGVDLERLAGERS